ncbi:MAG: hypothetical protein UW70_C0106G0001, partial [Candidatus Peregrinibacteria bacterium GW2011_GWA2_44_7]
MNAQALSQNDLMQFKYTATNNQGKTLSGIINAGNETLARTQLNN